MTQSKVREFLVKLYLGGSLYKKNDCFFQQFNNRNCLTPFSFSQSSPFPALRPQIASSQ